MHCCDATHWEQSPANNIRKGAELLRYCLAYSFSWGSYAILSSPFLFPWGAWFSALIVASATLGRAGLKDLLRCCLYWRVGLRWYLVALTVPIVIALAVVALNLLMGANVSTTTQISPWYSFFFLFPLALFDAPLLEETGWRGYALPQFSQPS